MSLRRSARQSKRMKQTKLALTPHPSSSPAVAKYLSPNVRTRAAAVTLAGSPNLAKKRKVVFSAPEDESDSEDELYTAVETRDGETSAKALPTPERSSQVKAPRRRHQPTVESDSDTSEKAGAERPEGKPVQRVAKPAATRRSTRQSRISFPNRQDEEVVERRRAIRSINEAGPVKAKSRPRTGIFGANIQQMMVELSSDSDSSTTGKAANGHDLGEAETSGDDVIVSSPTKKPKRTPARKATWVISDDSEEEVQITPKRGKLRKPETAEVEESDEEDDELPTTQRKRRLPPSTPRRRSKQEEEDLKEDLEFIGSSGGRLKGGPGKTSAKPVQTARQKALEVLRRQRAGDKVDSSAPAEETVEAGKKRALYDTDTESDYGEDGSEEVEDGDEIADPMHGPHEADAHDMFHANEYDEDFIVEDDEDSTLGAPVNLPLQFSSIARQKGKDLFKYAVEWMVQKKINPAFDISNKRYDLAFHKLDDEVRGLAGPKFTSSAWTPGFTQALRSRPEIDVTDTASMFEHCAACNRRGHPATWQIQFKGKPYHKETLEEVADDEDSDDEEADGMTYDAGGREVPDESIIYNVGRFCKQNAHIAHTLAHWRYHLNQWVVEYLKEEGHTAPEKIVERDEWSTKKRQKYAYQVADAMEKSGAVKRLYRDYRDEINIARDEKMVGSGRQLQLEFD